MAVPPFARTRVVRFSAMVALLLAVAGCGFNQVIVDDENVKAAWAEVQNQYKRRADLVPQLTATVKGAKNFEQETFIKVAEARSKVGSLQIDASTIEDPARMREFEAAQAKLGGAIGRLMVVAEKYPELRATSEFRDLQAQLEGTENRIAVARRRFIESVATYNKGVQMWPSALGAMLRGKAVRQSFEGTAGAETAPTVQF